MTQNPPQLFDDPKLFLNRELSWLEFNARVLGEALYPETPTLEKLKFLGIFTSNLDEFFMVRVSGLKKMLKEGLVSSESPDDMSSREILRKIRRRTVELLKMQTACFHKDIEPVLAKAGVILRSFKDLDKDRAQAMTLKFMNEVFPVLTPLAVDPAHPFPTLSNLHLYLLVEFDWTQTSENSSPPVAFVEVPTLIPRVFPVDAKKTEYILLEELIAHNLPSLFPGFRIKASYPLKITRNLDFTLLENEVVDLLKAIETKLEDRDRQEAVRLEISKAIPDYLIEHLRRKLRLRKKDIYKVKPPLAFDDLAVLCKLPLENMKDPPFNPRLPKELMRREDIFSLISKEDILIHHPYDSFYTVVEFIYSAAEDPDVLAIKQTLYRTSGDSPIIEALERAAENGKQVTAVVELKARFDEKNNIVWARRLERAGVNVVFGFIGLKTHCKMTLIIRKEKAGLRRYVHLGSGNYNSSTAVLYEDYGLLTANELLSNDVTLIFNLITGFNVLTGSDSPDPEATLPVLRSMALAPLNMRSSIIGFIEEEIKSHRKFKNGRIVCKMNALVDKEIIQALYRASGEGVKIDLVIRGMCCLRPGLKDVSENITVISIIDRFLEHSRVFYFFGNGDERVYVSSADWMPRNMDRRLEVMFPITAATAKKRIVFDLMQVVLNDNVKARELKQDGTYVQRVPEKDKPKLRSQEIFIEMARESGIKSIPYSVAIHQVPTQKVRRPMVEDDRKKLKKFRKK